LHDAPWCASDRSAEMRNSRLRSQRTGYKKQPRALLQHNNRRRG
jgi:hypothetical protein